MDFRSASGGLCDHFEYKIPKNEGTGCEVQFNVSVKLDIIVWIILKQSGKKKRCRAR